MRGQLRILASITIGTWVWLQHGTIETNALAMFTDVSSLGPLGISLTRKDHERAAEAASWTLERAEAEFFEADAAWMRGEPGTTRRQRDFLLAVMVRHRVAADRPSADSGSLVRTR